MSEARRCTRRASSCQSSIRGRRGALEQASKGRQKNSARKTHEGVLRAECVVRRRPSLPQGPPCSPIGAGKLNFRVRNGTGCFPPAMATETLIKLSNTLPRTPTIREHGTRFVCNSRTIQWTRNTFVERQALGLLVSVSSTHRYASTSDLSTQWSTGGLTTLLCGNPHLEACFPLRCFQRLSLPNVANQPCPWQNNWHTRG